MVRLPLTPRSSSPSSPPDADPPPHTLASPVQSFQDLERGLGQRAPLVRDTGIDPGPPPPLSPLLLDPPHRLVPLADPHRLAAADADLEFKKLARSIAVQVQKVAANTAAVAKFVDLLGSSKDNPTLRNRLCVPL